MSEQRLESLLPGVSRFSSGVNVYVVETGPQTCTVIDLGDGTVLDLLTETGRRVTDVLITHGHRTQFDGVDRLVGTDVRVHVNPEAAALKPDAMESFVAPLVPMRGRITGRFELPMPLPDGVHVCRDLIPGSSLRAGDVVFRVLAAPGHEPEQIALLAEVGGRRICFAGDAVYAQGKVYELFSTDLDHYTGIGARQAADTLAAIREAEPDLVLPSHGPGISEDVADGLLVTEKLLRAYGGYKDHMFFGQPRARDLKDGCDRPWGEDGPCHLSEHIWALRGNTFVITSDEDERACLLVDVCTGGAERIWRDLERLGTTQPEIMLSTQYHCDHLPSPDEKEQKFAATELWAQEAVAHVAEQNEALRRPALPAGRLTCERHLDDGEGFRWREHTFTAHFMPGQTDGHAGYSTAMDGRKMLFSGDNFYHPQQWGGYGGICGYNGAWDARAGYAFSARRILELAPDWILCEHDMTMAFERGMFEYVSEWAEELVSLQQSLSPGRDRARHCNTYLITFEPFVMAFQPGMARDVKAILDNRGSDRERRVKLVAAPPPGVTVEPAELMLSCGPEGAAEATCRLSVGKDAEPGKPLTMVPFRVTIDGQDCGRRNAVFLDVRP